MAAGVGDTSLDTKPAAGTGSGNVGKSTVATESFRGEIIGKSAPKLAMNALVGDILGFVADSDKETEVTGKDSGILAISEETGMLLADIGTLTAGLVIADGAAG